MKFEFSAGGLVYKKDNKGSVQFLLIGGTSLAGNSVWALPKGHIEKGEEVEAAAQREVLEETGVKAKVVKRLHNIEYFFKQEGELIKKKVYFLLMEYQSGELKPQADEVESVEWFSADEALGKISYDNEKDVLKKAVKELL